MKTPRIEVIGQPSRNGSPIVYIVYRNAVPIGRMEKYRNTHTDTHPYKAWRGIGPQASYMGAFYEDGSVPDDGDTKFGGREAAIKSITS